jgi:hypothetical protein
MASLSMLPKGENLKLRDDSDNHSGRFHRNPSLRPSRNSGLRVGVWREDRRPWGRDAAELNDARMATSRPDFQYTFHSDCGKKKWVLIRVEGRNSQNLRPGQVFPDGPPSGSEASPVQTPCTEIPRMPPRTPTRAFTISFHCPGVRGSSGLEVGSGSRAAVEAASAHSRLTLRQRLCRLDGVRSRSELLSSSLHRIHSAGSHRGRADRPEPFSQF